MLTIFINLKQKKKMQILISDHQLPDVLLQGNYSTLYDLLQPAVQLLAGRCIVAFC